MLFRSDCDLKTIIDRHSGGIPATGMAAQPIYADISEVPSYQELQNNAIVAKNKFMSLPAHLRRRFGNDPDELLAFLQDPNNKEEAIRLGLIEKPPTPPQNASQDNPKQDAAKSQTQADDKSKSGDSPDK